MKCYFCEGCGTRITDDDLSAGRGRNKKLKGVYCRQCAENVSTLETLPVSDKEAQEILEKMNGFPRMIVGLANDELGYIIPAWDYRAGEYEESMSVGAAAAPVVRDTALRMLLGIK